MIRATLRSSTAMVALLFVFGCDLARKDYADFCYERCCVWEGVEVGVISRRPTRTPVPSGRCGAVIAFPEGHPAAWIRGHLRTRRLGAIMGRPAGRG